MNVQQLTKLFLGNGRRKGSRNKSWLLIALSVIIAAVTMKFRRNDSTKSVIMNEHRRPNNEMPLVVKQFLATEFADELFQGKRESETISNQLTKHTNNLEQEEYLNE